MTATSPLAAILLADDEADDLYLIEYRLKKAGLGNPVVVFRDGGELIQYLDSGAPPPCILFLDLKMPRIDGFDVLMWIRQHPRLRTLPVVVISSSEKPDDKERAQRLGAFECLDKFPSAEQLSAAVSRASAHPFPSN